jgi:hypothetical protein
MADQKYVQVRLDDNIADGAVLTYDAKNDKITDSGMYSSQGELRAAAGSVNVGLQTLSSAGEQVIFRNENSHVNYAPPWHVIDEVNGGGSYDRFYDPLQTVTRFADKTAILENPVFDVYIPVEEVVYRLKMTFPVAHDDVEFKVTQSGHEMWREIKNVSAGDNEIVLDMPIAFHPGSYKFSIRPYTTPGIGTDMVPPVKVMGNAQTGQVGYDVVYRGFHEKRLATQEYVDTAVAGGVGTDLMTKAVYDTDNDGKVDIAAMADQAVQVVGITSARNNYYYGKDATGVIGFHALPLGADEAKLQALIEDNTKEIVTNKDAVSRHETAIDAHGVTLANHASQIRGADSTANSAMTLAQQNAETIVTNRKNAIKGVTVEQDSSAKTITLKFISDAGIVDTGVIDLSAWLTGGTNPPSTDHKIYYGFASSIPLSESEVLRSGTPKTVPTVAGLDINITRTSQSPSFIYVWLPDSVGTVKGFTFSGFLSTWGATALSIAGSPGKLYSSPNKTSATNINFEVTQ